MFQIDNYVNLLIKFPPRPITNEIELETTQKVIDSLIDKQPLSPEESDYLNVLGTLVSEYEQKQVPIPDIYGNELLKILISERGLKQKDLIAIFKTESIISDIIKGKRQLTTRHILELAEFFHISPAVFFPRTPRKEFLTI